LNYCLEWYKLVLRTQVLPSSPDWDLTLYKDNVGFYRFCGRVGSENKLLKIPSCSYGHYVFTVQYQTFPATKSRT